MTDVSAALIRPLVGDLRQVASVRRIVLDDGPERGVRALAFSTGGGLDFWVLSDRTLDIGPLNWRGRPIAWQTPTGFRSPSLMDLEADGGLGFLRGFSGMLVTCGLDGVRYGGPGRPLHGHLPFTPARVTAYGEDWDRDTPVLFCEGIVDQVRVFGEMLRLHRRIEADVGGCTLRIQDRVVNLGPEPQDHQILYHINPGWPALATGSQLTLDGRPIVPPFEPVAQGGGRSSLVFPSGPGPVARCELTLPDLGGRLTVAFDTATLPFLQVWRDPRPQSHVMAIEPVTSDKNADGTSGPPVVLAPGAVRDYRLSLGLSDV